MTFRVENVIIKVERDEDLIAIFTAPSKEDLQAAIARCVIIAYVDGTNVIPNASCQ